ncbi:uncharacterized protein LOC119742573 [Patiria miniata]|uniref:Uncharacterized protein n=1 Tax=Patiria miniata TaxID=46514 RepID=A0A914BGN7_PATMI|nr:uncharacterized protein LOC119742573 [Patiria miniata]
MANTLGSLRVLCVVLFMSPAWFDEALATERPLEPEIESNRTGEHAQTDEGLAPKNPGAVDVTLGEIVIAITQEASCCGRCNKTGTLYERNGSAPCYCDEHCLVYTDCCLDFELYCTDLESRLVQPGDGGLWQAFQNCSDGQGTSPTTTIWSFATDNGLYSGECSVWQAIQDYSDSAAREYACKLEALWVPVILARRANRLLVRVAGGYDFDYVLVGSCGNNSAKQEMVGLCGGMGSGSFETLDDVKGVVPVTAPDGLHYRNAYCAQCNGFSEADLQFWQVKLNCPADVAVTGLTDSSIGSCSVGRVSPPNPFMWNAPQPRMVSFKYGCFCSLGAWPAVCGVYQLKSGQCCRGQHCQHQCRCFILGVMYVDAEAPFGGQFLPISALFDFSSHRDLRFSLGDQPQELVCNQGTYFDVALRSCRRFFCPSGQRLGAHGECVAAITDPCLLSDLGDPPVCLLDLEFQTKTREVDLVQSRLIESLMNATANVTLTPLRPIDCPDLRQSPYCKFLVIVESQFTFAETATRFLSTWRHLIAQWQSDSYVTFQKLTLMNFGERKFLIDKCARLGQTPVRYSFGSDFKKFEINGTSFVNIRVDNGSVTCPSERTFKEVVFTSPGDVEEFVHLCEMKLNCSLVVLNSSDFSWLDNTTVELSSGGNLSSEEVIKISDEEVVVCRQPDECPNCRESFSGIFSVVGLIVSQVFLLLTLLSFCVFPELCTLPGKNLFCFIAALFLTQMVFLLGPGSPLGKFTTANNDTCLAFAVTIHYLLLATFFWSNVVSLHLARTFGFRLRMRSERFGRAFLWYSLYGWGAPALISATSCILHHLLVVDGKRVIIYGIDSSICTPYMDGMLYLVSVPISVLMCSNAVFFVQTVVGIRRTRKSTSMVQKEKRKLERLQSEAILCIKIFVATGMTWFLIALLGYFSVEGFSYFFTVLISSQGPLLFLSFAFTERIRDMWRAKFCDRVRCTGVYSTKETAVSSVSRAVGAGLARHAGNKMHDSSDDSLIRIDGKAMLLEDKTTDNLYEHVFSDNEVLENQF